MSPKGSGVISAFEDTVLTSRLLAGMDCIKFVPLMFMLEFDDHCGYVGINIFHVGSVFPTPAQVTSVSRLFCTGPFACLQQPFVRQLVTPQSVSPNQLLLNMESPSFCYRDPCWW